MEGGNHWRQAPSISATLQCEHAYAASRRRRQRCGTNLHSLSSAQLRWARRASSRISALSSAACSGRNRAEAAVSRLGTTDDEESTARTRHSPGPPGCVSMVDPQRTVCDAARRSRSTEAVSMVQFEDDRLARHAPTPRSPPTTQMAISWLVPTMMEFRCGVRKIARGANEGADITPEQSNTREW